MGSRTIVDPDTGQTTVVAFTAPPTEPATYIPPTPKVYAIAQFTLVDGDISNIDLTAGFSFVMVISPGVAWAFFEVPMVDLAYTWNVNSTEGECRVTDGRTVDYVEISMNDNSGNPLQTGTIALQIYKVN